MKHKEEHYDLAVRQEILSCLRFLNPLLKKEQEALPRRGYKYVTVSWRELTPNEDDVSVFTVEQLLRIKQDLIDYYSYPYQDFVFKVDWVRDEYMLDGGTYSLVTMIKEPKTDKEYLNDLKLLKHQYREVTKEEQELFDASKVLGTCLSLGQLRALKKILSKD